MANNKQIVNAAGAINTNDLKSGGYLNPEQAQKFIQQTFEKTALGNLIRHVQKHSKTGEIDKIGIDSRILRAKTEDTDDGYRAKPNHNKLTYATTAVRLPWELTEETLRENIEGQHYEEIVTNLMTTQLGIDREDLLINGDTATLESADDYDFLKINDGWYKLVMNGGHTIDHSSINSGNMNDNTFYNLLLQMPNKFQDGKLRWLMAPSRKTKWEQYLVNAARSSGGVVTDGLINNPAGIPIVTVPKFPAGAIMLVNPQNLVAIDTYNVIIRKTTEGKEAVMQDKRFYVVHFDMDAIVEELDATALTYGLN